MTKHFLISLIWINCAALFFPAEAVSIADKFVKTESGLQIAIRHEAVTKDKVIIIAPGFYNNKDTPTFKNIEHDLKANFDVIPMDFRGHGQSEGFYTFSANEHEDLKAVIDYARIHYRKVGVLGFSYGGSTAIIEQSKWKNIDSIVCVGTPMSSKDIENRWWTPSALRLGMENFELGKGARPGNPFLPKIRSLDVVDLIGCPIFFIHGEIDPTVDVRHSKILYEKAKDPKKLEIFKNAGHAEEIYQKDPEDFIEVIESWFSTTL